MTGRIVIDDVRPSTPHAGYRAKVVEGEVVPVSATVFKDGHDVLAARALLLDPAGAGDSPVATAPLHPDVNDRWQGRLAVPPGLGTRALVVEAWTDRHATWAHRVQAKLTAGQELGVEIDEGLALLAGAPRLAGAGQRRAVAAAAAVLADRSLPDTDRVAPALAAEVAQALAGPAGGADLTSSPPVPLWVDRERALVGAWYELFPRSFGGFQGVVKRVPALAEAGFDVLYLPPIHPIGRTGRKGPGNTLDASVDDPGSPWAIGGPEGGHTAIHPELGTFEDFSHLVDTLAEQGMELALDYALNCSPDHPWVREHPEWFHHRADGTIAFAENPPKRYEDIYPLNFWPPDDADRRALWHACRDVLEFWIERGVRVFRVDNPHTKPVALWEWLIPAVQDRHPDVVFLSEAFTRPAVMAKLAEIGFSQSYTYFTWRTEQHGPEGLWAYMEELAHGPKADYMRPNFWPNTPDILSGPLRGGPPAAFALRYVLAATLAPSYGIYSGYELYENQPAAETNEEYLHSEKYELKQRDFDRPGSLAPFIATVNGIRRRHPAFSRLRTLRMHPSDNPAVFAYSKTSDDGADAVLVVVTLDPVDVQESTLHLDLEELGVAADRPFPVFDELSGDRYLWTADPYVRLDPRSRVAHVLDLRAASGPHRRPPGPPAG